MVLDFTKLFLFSAGSLLVQTLFMLLAFFFSRKYIEVEKSKLKIESTHADLGLVLLFAMVISTIIFFAGTLAVSAVAKYYFKNPEYLYSSFFELLVIFSAILLTSTAVFSKPKEHLRIKGVTNSDSQNVHKKLSRITLVSIFIAMFSYAAINTFLGTKYCLICEYGAMAVIVIYCFLEISSSKNLLSRVLVIRKTNPPFNSEKLVSFLNKKFHYVMLACMVYAAEITDSIQFNEVSAFSHINNIYFFLLAVMAFQGFVVIIVNKLASYINSLEYKHTSEQIIKNRSKNISWICDFVVFALYFSAVCLALQYAGFRINNYVFNEYFVVIVAGSFITLMICRVFNEFRDSILEKAEKGDREHYQKLKTFAPTISWIFYVLVVVTSLLIILSNLGMNVIPVITSFSIVGAAFGLAAQDIIKAFLNGVVLLIEKNLYVGTYVDINNKSGVIERLSLRTLYLRGIEGFLHVIPYHTITSITNHSDSNRTWSAVLRLTSISDFDKASKILKETIDEMREEEEYRDKVFSGANIYGLEQFDLTGIKIKWEVVTIPTLVHFLDDVYQRLAEKFVKNDIKVPDIAKNISVSV